VIFGKLVRTAEVVKLIGALLNHHFIAFFLR
jgi:hypothetical protein